jgi:hypothetical protein
MLPDMFDALNTSRADAGVRSSGNRPSAGGLPSTSAVTPPERPLAGAKMKA